MKGGFLDRVGEMAEEGKFKVEKFNEQNYQLWKIKMEKYLHHDNISLPFGWNRKEVSDYEGQRV